MAFVPCQPEPDASAAVKLLPLPGSCPPCQAASALRSSMHEAVCTCLVCSSGKTRHNMPSCMLSSSERAQLVSRSANSTDPNDRNDLMHTDDRSKPAFERMRRSMRRTLQSMNTTTAKGHVVSPATHCSGRMYYNKLYVCMPGNKQSIGHAAQQDTPHHQQASTMCV